MPTLSPELFNILTQGGLGAIAIWLIIDTRAESRDREKKALEREERLRQESQAREGRLQGMLDQYGQQLPRITSTLDDIKEELEKIREGRK